MTAEQMDRMITLIVCGLILCCILWLIIAVVICGRRMTTRWELRNGDPYPLIDKKPSEPKLEKQSSAEKSPKTGRSTPASPHTPLRDISLDVGRLLEAEGGQLQPVDEEQRTATSDPSESTVNEFIHKMNPPVALEPPPTPERGWREVNAAPVCLPAPTPERSRRGATLDTSTSARRIPAAAAERSTSGRASRPASHFHNI